MLRDKLRLCCVMMLMTLACGKKDEAHKAVQNLEQVPEMVAKLALIDSIGGGGVLGRPQHFTKDALGNIFIYDGADNKIFVYDRLGRFRQTIGQKGDGPGEFKNNSTMACWRDTLYVFDPALQRLSLFHTSGQFVRSLNFSKFNSGYWFVPWLHPTESGYYILRDTVVVETSQSGAKLIRIDPAGKSLQRLQTYLLPAFVRKQGGATGWEAYNTVAIAFSSRAELWMSCAETYRLDILDKNGFLLRTITQAFDRQPYSEEERKRRKEFPSITLNGVPFYVDLPQFMQDIWGIFYDNKDRIWVGTSRRSKAGYLFHVYDEAGNFREQLWLPIPDKSEYFFRLQIYGDQCWWLGRNAQEETVLFRARIIKPPA